MNKKVKHLSKEEYDLITHLIMPSISLTSQAHASVSLSLFSLYLSLPIYIYIITYRNVLFVEDSMYIIAYV